jgi:DNA-binding transcriptional regulator YiaG
MSALSTRQTPGTSKSIMQQEPPATECGKVVPFPEMGCQKCAAPPRVLSPHQPSMAYAEFSFLPIALQRWRKRNGLKISAAAHGLGVAASAWGHWETGFRFPTGSMLLALVQYTRLSLVELLCEHGQYCPSRQ